MSKRNKNSLRLVAFTALSLLFCYMLPGMVQAAFTDVPNTHPYFDSINHLQTEGIIQGYEDGSFRPLQTVTRAELLKMGILGFGYAPDPNAPEAATFPDVAQTDWFYRFVQFAKKNGVIKGYPDGTFKPHQQVNTVEAFKILLLIKTLSQDQIDEGFGDRWFQPYVDYLQGRNLVEGIYDENAPDKLINRGAIAELMYRLMQGSQMRTQFVSSLDAERSLNDNQYIQSVAMLAREMDYEKVRLAVRMANENVAYELFQLDSRPGKQAFIVYHRNEFTDLQQAYLFEAFDENGATVFQISDAKSSYRVDGTRLASELSISKDANHCSTTSNRDGNVDVNLSDALLDTPSYDPTFSAFGLEPAVIHYGLHKVVQDFMGQARSSLASDKTSFGDTSCMVDFLLHTSDFWGSFAIGDEQDKDVIATYVRPKGDNLYFTIQNIGEKETGQFSLKYQLEDWDTGAIIQENETVFFQALGYHEATIIEETLQNSLPIGNYRVKVEVGTDGESVTANNKQVFFLYYDGSEEFFVEDYEVCYECRWTSDRQDEKAALVKFYEDRNPEEKYYNADIEYVLGVMNGSRSRMCGAAKLYEELLPDYNYPLLLNEILMFMGLDGCEIDGKKYFEEAINRSKGWKKAFYRSLRSKTLSKIIKPISIKGGVKAPSNTKQFILGKTYIDLTKIKKIGVQTERVTRDWLGSDMITYPGEMRPADEIMTYHEGSRVRNILEFHPDIEVVPLTGTVVLNSDDKWYAPDENGNFRFEVLPGKVTYATNKCYNNVCLLYDTHGISSLVAQAIEEDVDMVVGCGDYHGKTQAAYYLAQKGIDVYMPADRFSAELIGYDAVGTLLGTAPVKIGRVGGQPVVFDVNETIVLSDTDKPYPAQYYDAPVKYFEILERSLPLNLDKVIVDDIGQMYKITDRAREIKAKAVGVRVRTEEDYDAVKKWLDESSGHRAILFHSSLYKPSQDLFLQYPTQTTFGDPYPEFVTDGDPITQEDLKPKKTEGEVSVALTFRDTSKSIEKVAQLFEDYGHQATFFITSDTLTEYETGLKVLKSLVDSGVVEVGNHGKTSNAISSSNTASQEREIIESKEALETFFGETIAFFRPIYGEYSFFPLKIMSNSGQKIALWDVDGDGFMENPSVDDIINQTINNAKNGEILLYNMSSTVIQALPHILNYFDENGIRAVTMSDMYEQLGGTMSAHIDNWFVYEEEGQKMRIEEQGDTINVDYFLTRDFGASLIYIVPMLYRDWTPYNSLEIDINQDRTLRPIYVIFKDAGGEKWQWEFLNESAGVRTMTFAFEDAVLSEFQSPDAILNGEMDLEFVTDVIFTPKISERIAAQARDNNDGQFSVVEFRLKNKPL